MLTEPLEIHPVRYGHSHHLDEPLMLLPVPVPLHPPLLLDLPPAPAHKLLHHAHLKLPVLLLNPPHQTANKSHYLLSEEAFEVDAELPAELGEAGEEGRLGGGGKAGVQVREGQYRLLVFV